ncbi:MAG: 5-histidylcysteine sulfoxide synthase, partial [Sinobacteraceae bacterium]|nr:5-histidylcysteine sulfoxide synthase [Nevskiaceae bacterium]
MDIPTPSALSERHKTTHPTRRFALAGSSPQDVREGLKAYFLETFDCYESLFTTLACDAAWFERPIPLRHPLIFYYGHTATFFVNKLLLTRLIDTRIDAQMESTFAVGVDEMSWDDLDENHYNWPTVAQVQAYRDQVRAMVCEVIDTAPLTLPIDWNNPWWAIIMGVEHERIHLETSSVLIRQQRLDYVRERDGWESCTRAGAAPENTLVEVPAGHTALGKAFSAPRYGWDNEYGRHEAEVGAFKTSRMLVSNGEFLEFMQAGGYANDTWWDEEGRNWKAFAEATHPTFWVADTNAPEPDWRLRLMTHEMPMPWNWPVEVNNLEARAFCRWKAEQTGHPVRLPSEDEWHRILAHSGWQLPTNGPVDANLHLEHWKSACPVDHFRHGPFCDVVGNVWQWTATPTYPFEGFETHPIYDDFTTPTFDAQHDIIKGGSWIACGNEAEPESRYAFRRHFFQHAGFRYVVAETDPVAPSSRYETDSSVSEYIEFHYGPEYFGVPNFPRALAELAIQAVGDGPHASALDLRCATGPSTFELAQHFDQVL